MTPAPTPNKTEKKASPLTTLLAYIQRMCLSLGFITFDLFLDFYIYLYWIFRDKKIVERLFAYVQRQWRLLALVTLYIFFRPTFEGYIASLLESFEPSVGSFVIWLLLIVIALVYTYILSRRRYVLSEGLRAWTVVVLGGWAYYRFVGATHYEATPILQIPWACYIDLFFVLCLCIAIITGRSYWMRRKSKKEVADTSKAGYHVEYPCTSKDEDLLGRRKEAETLAEKIFQTDTSRGAFTLGLTAPWGAGKTSFMLVMKEYLERQHDEKTIVIEFNPWRYRKAPNLTQIFFEELSRALAPYNSALSSGFVRYVDLLLAKDSNPWLQLASRLLPQESNEKSTGEQYDFLTREISKLGRKIFIFIDDVDRLEREELVELFALVRNSSSFPCISYILVYDKEYVASQLKGCFDQHTHRYMEKIVQAEYPLAKITPEQIERAFLEELVEVSPTYNPLARYIISSIELGDYLPTLRAVKRICNTFLSVRKTLEGNVAPFDWFIVELIRVQYPDLFAFLKENHKKALDSCGDTLYIGVEMGGEEIYRHYPTDKENLTASERLQKFRTYLYEYGVNFQLEDATRAFALMASLWGRHRQVAPRQANHQSYIGRYFYGTLRAIEIDESEFYEHMSLPFDTAYIEEKLTNGQLKDFARKIRQNLHSINSIEKAEVYLQTAFYIGSIGYTTVLFEKEEIDSLIQSLKDHLNDEKELKKKIDYIFGYPELRLGVLLYLSMVTIKDYEPNPSFIMELFDPGELRIKKEKLFLEYIEERSLSPESCYLLWRECRTYEQDELNSGEIIFRPTVCQSTNMDGKIKEIIKENIGKIIPRFIGGNSEYGYYLILPDPIWNLNPKSSDSSTDSFSDFIFNLNGDQPPVISEFQEFLNRWIHREEEADKYMSYQSAQERKEGLSTISFKFKHIIPAGITHIINTNRYLIPYDYD